jgi:hypothetical protein
VDVGLATHVHRKPVRFPPRAEQVVAIAPDDAVLGGHPRDRLDPIRAPTRLSTGI